MLIGRHSFIRQSKLSDVAGRIDYISNPKRQEYLYATYQTEGVIMEYNEELWAWKNQTEQKKENPLEQPKKASVLEKLHRYQQEGRQQPKRSVKKKSMDRER